MKISAWNDSHPDKPGFRILDLYLPLERQQVDDVQWMPQILQVH